LATKWVSTMKCKWCQGEARVGIEKDGQGQTYRVICAECGISEQAGMNFPAGQEITRIVEGCTLNPTSEQRCTAGQGDIYAAIMRGDPLPIEEDYGLGTWAKKHAS